MNKEKLENIQKQLRDWFWKYGSKRKDAYVLPYGDWLDKMETAFSCIARILDNDGNTKRPAVALWGPSQTGKSTLLGTFIDHGGGALSWGKSFKFVSDDGGKTPSLNPYNHKSDASGCVTRFVMREHIEHEDAPIKITFAGEREILMSLAFGYLTEMDCRNHKGDTVAFTSEQISKLLGEIQAKPNGRVKPELFLRLQLVLEVLEALILGGNIRYKNLAGERWTTVRQDILGRDALLYSDRDFESFVAKLFWDDKEGITDIYRKLLRAANKIENDFAGKAVFCSLDVGALFLDISAASNEGTLSKIHQISRKSLGGNDVGFFLSEQGLSQSYFSGNEDFAYIQGLVLQLEVPLREDVIHEANDSLYELLKIADIVDFPGVAREERGNEESLLKDEDVISRPIEALTRVVKRGKTASIVIGNAQNLDIDVFSLLIRMNEPPSKPKQLYSGIEAWHLSMLGESLSSLRERILPLNIVQTFAQELINETKIKYDQNGLKDIFAKLSSLRPLSDANHANYFAINYEKFAPIPTQGKELKEIVKKIREDLYYKKYYKSTPDSVDEMCGLKKHDRFDGGRSYYFNALKKQITASKRNSLLQAKKASLIAQIRNELIRALPPEGDETAARENFLQMSIQKFEKILNDEEWSQKVSRTICQMLGNAPETMGQIPQNILPDIQAYAKRIYEKMWKQVLAGTQFFDFDTNEERERFVRYFLLRIEPDKISAWLRKRLVNVTSGNELLRNQIREGLSLWIERELLRSNTEDRICVPAEQRWIGKLISALKTLVKEHTTARGYQDGDKELTIIAKNFDEELQKTL